MERKYNVGDVLHEYKIKGDIISTVEGDIISTVEGDIISTVEGDIISTVEVQGRMLSGVKRGQGILQKGALQKYYTILIKRTHSCNLIKALSIITPAHQSHNSNSISALWGVYTAQLLPFRRI